MEMEISEKTQWKETERKRGKERRQGMPPQPEQDVLSGI